MFGFIEREQILLKQNVYDLLHNTRIGKKAFLFIIWYGLLAICKRPLGLYSMKSEIVYDI